jgi:hypothetical protein
VNRSRSVIIVLADGARADSLAAAIAAGELPALARLSAEGSFNTITTVFPSVTGPAYSPFLMGLHPGSVGLPGLRWYDRERNACSWPSYSRSYIGPECLLLDRDLAASAPTVFELEPSSIGALSVIRRGLPKPKQIGSGAAFVARTALTHFRGKLSGWLDIDRYVGDHFVRRVRDERPRFAFAAFTGIDKASHAMGHDAPVVHDAMRIVDDVCARIRADAEHDGTWNTTDLWVVSDHGHSPVAAHDDLAGHVASLGNRVIAHPWVVRPGADVMVAVSGNSMAHIYVELGSRKRIFQDRLSSRWTELADAIVARDSVDLMLLPQSEDACRIRTRDRGTALVSWRSTDGVPTYSYLPDTGDPLGIGEITNADDAEAFDTTFGSCYPDALVQIARLAACSRSGDMILSAAPGWDFRAHYEPIPHVSSHGALHREHMLVPLITNRTVAGTPRRTVDVMASVCAALDLQSPGIDGVSYIR